MCKQIEINSSIVYFRRWMGCNRARCNDVHTINPEACLALVAILFRLLSRSKTNQIVGVVFVVRHNFYLGTHDVEHGSIALITVSYP
jgi:hypothetical protein